MSGKPLHVAEWGNYLGDEMIKGYFKWAGWRGTFGVLAALLTIAVTTVFGGTLFKEFGVGLLWLVVGVLIFCALCLLTEVIQDWADE